MAWRYVSDVTRTWYSSLQESTADPQGRPTRLLLATAAGSLGAWLAWDWYRNRNRKLPPSPRGWPIIGSMLEISADKMHEDLLRIQKKNGLPDVFTLYIGPGNKMVVLNSYAAIKDAFVTQGNMFSVRTPSFSLEVMKLHEVTDDKFFVSQKPFFATALRNAGFGSNKNSEDKILEQFDILVDHLEPKIDNNEPIDIDNVMFKLAANVIFHIIFAKVYSLDDAELHSRVDLFKAWYGKFLKAFTMDMCSEMFVNLFMRDTKKQLLTVTADCMEFIRQEIKEHKETLDPEHPRDFVDIVLSKRDETVIDDEKLAGMAFLFLPDSIDTVSGYIAWVVLYVTHNPEVQRRIQKELDDVTSGARHVTWSDRPKIPYTEAVVMEVIRHSCPVPTTGFHCSAKDTYFRGHYIPAGLPVIANLYAAMMDPKNFTEPENFNPDRFLSEDGALTNTDTWIAFGMGSRKCLGEQLAKIEVILLVANLFHRYDLSFPENMPAPPLTGRADLAIKRPQDFRVIIKPRK